ncbi:MAG: hypothetical protein Q8R53_00160 [Nanoarchaeota archaeon]|nr:hypothetical protein [Nanoarchaeota archaeon]
MKRLTGLAALLLGGALACMDETLPAPSAEDPSCKEGRVWYERTCVDPSEVSQGEAPSPEHCQPSAEQVCLDGHVFGVDSCGIWEGEPRRACPLPQPCYEGACTPGEELFWDPFEISLDRWHVKGDTQAVLEDESDVLRMSGGSIESRQPYDRSLITPQSSVYIEFVMRMDDPQGIFSNLCSIQADGQADLFFDLYNEGPIATGIDTREWHLYAMRYDDIGDQKVQVTLAIDNRQEFLLQQVLPREVIGNLALFWCWRDYEGSTANTCWLDYVLLLQVPREQ